MSRGKRKSTFELAAHFLSTHFPNQIAVLDSNDQLVDICADYQALEQKYPDIGNTKSAYQTRHIAPPARGRCALG